MAHFSGGNSAVLDFFNIATEAWHAMLGRRTGTGNHGMYQLAERLHDEGKLVAISHLI